MVYVLVKRGYKWIEFFMILAITFTLFLFAGLWIAPYTQQLFLISKAVCRWFFLQGSLLSGAKKYHILPTGNDLLLRMCWVYRSSWEASPYFSWTPDNAHNEMCSYVGIVVWELIRMILGIVSTLGLWMTWLWKGTCCGHGILGFLFFHIFLFK